MGKEIKILVFSKQGKVKGKTFFNYRTSMNIVVKGEEDKGLQKKTVDVKFRQTANIPGKTIGKDYLRGYLVCEDSKVDAPIVWAIKEVVNEDGETVRKYPAVWISEVKGYTEAEKRAAQSAFVLEDEPSDEESDLGGSDE